MVNGKSHTISELQVTENLESTMLVNLEVILTRIMFAILSTDQSATLLAIVPVALLAILTANQSALLTADLPATVSTILTANQSALLTPDLLATLSAILAAHQMIIVVIHVKLAANLIVAITRLTTNQRAKQTEE